MITTVIPIHNNSPQRDLKRLYYQLLSLSNQTIPCNVVISTDSNDEEVRAIELIVLEMSLKAQSGTWIKVIRHDPQYNGEFNLPFLVNRGIEATDSEWLLITGIDFIYHPQYLETLLEMSNPNTFTMSYVRMMPTAHYEKIKDWWIEKWEFPGNYQKNGGQESACGLQCFNLSWFDKSKGLCEQIYSYSGMDEEFRNRAKNSGLKLQWLDRHVIHLPHPSGKNYVNPSREQRRNWKIRDLLNEHKVINWRKFRKYPSY